MAHNNRTDRTGNRNTDSRGDADGVGVCRDWSIEPINLHKFLKFQKGVMIMIFGRKNKHAEEQEEIKPVKKIVLGKLYDTSKAEFLLSFRIDTTDIPGYSRGIIVNVPVDLYKGNEIFFLVYFEDVYPVANYWVKDLLGRIDVDLYIKLFGEPELA